jgi:hypothetical protein
MIHAAGSVGLSGSGWSREPSGRCRSPHRRGVGLVPSTAVPVAVQVARAPAPARLVVVDNGAPLKLPRTVKALGFVSLLTDVSSEMIYPLLPAFLTGVLRAGPAFLGAVEGLAETVASLLKLLAGRLSDTLPRRKPLVVAGYSLSSLTRPLVALAQARLARPRRPGRDRVGKGVRGAPRDALVADVTPASDLGRAYGFHRAMDHAGARPAPDRHRPALVGLEPAFGVRLGRGPGCAERGGAAAGSARGGTSCGRCSACVRGRPVGAAGTRLPAVPAGAGRLHPGQLLDASCCGPRMRAYRWLPSPCGPFTTP